MDFYEQVCLCTQVPKWGFPKIRGTLSGIPIIRIIIFWGLHWGPLIQGNYQIITNIILSGRIIV